MKELVAVFVDGAWEIVYDISLSINKNIIEQDEVIVILEENFPMLYNATYNREMNDLFATLDTEVVEMINRGTNTK